MRIRHFLLILFSLPFIANAQQYEINDIPLRWSDFNKIAKNVSGNAVAQTYVSLEMKQETIQEKDVLKLTIDIKLKQDKEKSWVKKQFLFSQRDSVTQAMLNHEKMHLVINLNNFQKLYQSLDTLVYSMDYKSQIAIVMGLYKLENELENITYDRETFHGTIADQQKIWEVKTMQTFNELYPKKAPIEYSYKIVRRIPIN